MILSARLLDNYVDINNFDVTNQLSVTSSYPPVPGQAVTLTLQLADISKDRASQGFSPAGRRYVPMPLPDEDGNDTPVKLQVNLVSINQANNCTYYGTWMKSAGDGSIWQILVPESDFGKLKRGTWNMVCALTVNGSVMRFTVPNALNVIPQTDF